MTEDQHEVEGPYSVRFQHAGSYDWFTVRLYYGDQLIGQKSVCKSYPRAARWAKRKAQQHRKALEKLAE